MTSTLSYLLPHEAAELLEIRLARVAQLLRTGILPYQETKDFPLIDRRDCDRVAELFPALIAQFQEEKQGKAGEEVGESLSDPKSFKRPSTVALMRCVNAAHPTVPIGQ